MLYTLLGRTIWRIFRGYLRYQFPNAGRNLAIAGIAGAVAVGALTGARRRSASARRR